MYKQFGVAALLGLALGAGSLRADQGGPAAGKAAHPYLGVAVSPAPDGNGVMVREAEPGGPAAEAGLKKGDVIVRVDGREVEGPQALVNLLARHRPGDALTFHVTRDGREQDVRVTLDGRRRAFSNAPPAGAPRGRAEGDGGAEKGTAFLGVEAAGMDELTPRFKRRLGISDEKGVVVLEVMPDSPAAKAGLGHGDVITAVNGQAVEDAEQLREAVRKAGAGGQARLEVMRGGQKKEIDARLEEAPVEGFRMLPAAGLAGEGAESRRVEQLERRIERLEKRLNDLEKGKSKPQE
jgi:S1-C subfamily serine protease